MDSQAAARTSEATRGAFQALEEARLRVYLQTIWMTFRVTMKPLHVPAAVLLSPEEFDRLTYRARFLDAVGEGLADADAGRTVSDEALGKLLDAEFGKLKP